MQGSSKPKRRRRRKNSDAAAAEVSAAARRHRRLPWGGAPSPHVTGRLRPLSTCHKPNETSAAWVPKAQSLAKEQRMPKKYWLQLEKFDGNNMPFETFLAKLENCSRYNGWTERDQLAHLQASLTHGAAQCLWDVGESHRDSLHHLLALLKSRFGSEGQAEKYRAELKARRRRSGETLQSLSRYSASDGVGFSRPD
jgi:hypothetical protein